MTWMTTWPTGTHGRPAYAEHDTEQAAEQHAVELVRSNTARTATVFELDAEGDRP